MALAPEDLNQVRADLAFVFFELWSKYRGLLHVLGERGQVVPERVETEIRDWIEQNQNDLVRESTARLKEYFDTPVSG